MSTPATTPLDFRNTNALWCSVLVETLYRLGLRHAVISPGSRSTPLTFACARHEGIESIPVLDERSASFFALGLARQHHRPVMLLCTSGTAGANYFSAVIEAQESGVPLLVITADRPPEMRACRSGQTIDQQKLFGSHVNFFHELAVPVASEPMLAYLRQTIAHAWERAMQPSAGPVHLNAPFRDPLPPLRDKTALPLKGRIGEDFFSHLTRTPIAAERVSLPELPKIKRGLIVVGPAQPASPVAFTRLVETLARNTGWPVLADSLSPLRSHAAAGAPFITSYDALMRNASRMKKLQPDFVLSLDGWPISKTLRAWLREINVSTWLITSALDNPDALHGRTKIIRSSLDAFVHAFPKQAGGESFTAEWRGADATMRAAIDARLTGIKWKFEGKAAWLLAKNLPAGTPLFVANSMPVRDLEYFGGARSAGASVYFNRGANGIDGTLSTALGIAHRGNPSVLLTGDLALLHDSNGFLLRPKFKGGLTIVLINNQGGGIFGHLPVADFNPPFEEFFATPQAADFRRLAAAHGVAYLKVNSWKQFTALISRLPARGIRILELRTDRKRDAAFRQELFATLAR